MYVSKKRSGVRALERLAERRVADVGIERDDARIDGGERSQGPAIGGARRDSAAERVRRIRERRRCASRDRPGGASNGRGDDGRPRSGDETALELGNGAVEVVAGRNRLAVPAVLPFDGGHAVPLDRAGKDHRRLPGRARRLLERLQDGADVVAVDDDGVPPEGPPARPVGLHVVSPLRRAALPEAVDVGEGAQVVEPVALRDLRRLPYRPLRRLAVADEHVGAVGGGDATRVEGDADRGTDALPQRPGRHVDERQPRRRVPFQVAVDAPEAMQLVRWHVPRLRPSGVEQRRRVPLGQHEAVAVVVLRPARVEAHVAEEERRDEVRRRAATRRMAAPRRARCPHGLDTEPGGDVLEGGDRRRAIGRHGKLLAPKV